MGLPSTSFAPSMSVFGRRVSTWTYSTVLCVPTHLHAAHLRRFEEEGSTLLMTCIIALAAGLSPALERLRAMYHNTNKERHDPVHKRAAAGMFLLLVSAEARAVHCIHYAIDAGANWYQLF